jgi:hypothetical protein
MVGPPRNRRPASTSLALLADDIRYPTGIRPKFRTSCPVSCDETSFLHRYTSIRQHGLYCEYDRFIPWKIAAVDPVGDPRFSDVGESVMAKLARQHGLGKARTTQQVSKTLRELIPS